MSVEERFWAKVDRSGDCWIWNAYRTDKGYGRFQLNNKWVRAHRWIYEKHVGPIPAGLVIDHRCSNKSCVRPDHLRVVTPRENSMENGWAAVNARKRTCHKGHPFTHIDTQGYRACQTCIDDRNRAKREARRAVA